MKKYFLISFLAIISQCVFAQLTKEQAVKNISSDNIVVADDARLQLEKMSAEKELLDALENVKDKKLRDGLLYSLGSMKSQKAYEKIRSVAFAEKDGCPAAVLALANYKTSNSAKDLKLLADENCKIANTAIFLARDAKNKSLSADKVKRDWAKADENMQVWLIANMTLDKKAENFLRSLEPSNERLATTKAVALSKIGGKQNAQEIINIAKNYNNFTLEAALAECRYADEVIASEIEKENIFAVKVAKISNSAFSESKLLALLDTVKDSNLRRAIFDTLQEIGAEKTVEKLVADFPNADKSQLQFYVKVLTFSFNRVDDNFKKSMSEKLSQNSVIDDAHKNAAQRILTAKKK